MTATTAAAIVAALAAPFPPEAVSWRIGNLNADKTRALALAYIDARDVMHRLDDVVGPFGWQSEHHVVGTLVTCAIGVRNPETGEWISKSDGAGQTDVEGDKGSYSDALKRAAVSWGIGRYLYDTDSPWVAVEPAGRSYKIAEGERPKLLAALRRSAPPLRQPGPGNAPGNAPEMRQPAPATVPGAGDPFTPTEPKAAEPAVEPPAAAPPPAAPPGTIANPTAIMAAFWQRADYAILPDVIEGGVKRWGWWFQQFARSAPSIAALTKLRADNRTHHQRWADTAAAATVTQLAASIATIERRLAKPVPVR